MLSKSVAVSLLSFSLACAALAGVGCEASSSNAQATKRAPSAPVEMEASPKLKPTAFDGDRAFAHVKRQVEFGPRPAGSEAIKKTREFLIGELKSYGLKVSTDAFVGKTPSPKFPSIPMENVIAELPGKTDDVLIVASHYDTKYFENIKFLGANDGGSSTGALLEIARVLSAMKPEEREIPQTLWFVFFDGEEAVVEWSEDFDSTYGSRHMVSSLKASGKAAKIKGVILLDMIGDADLVIPKEAQSTPWISETLAETGRALGYEKNFPLSSHYISDDHIPFLKAGIPAADLIDFTYGTNAKTAGPGGETNAYWHSAEDTLDKISPKSLKIVGDTVIRALPKIAAQAR